MSEQLESYDFVQIFKPNGEENLGNKIAKLPEPVGIHPVIDLRYEA